MAVKGWSGFRRVIGIFFKPGISLPNCLTVLGVLIILMAVFKPSSSELASWVQAVGSIAAIYGAFWISKRQSDAEQLARIRLEHAKASSIKDLIAAALPLVKNISEVTRFDIPARTRLSSFKFFWSGVHKNQLDVLVKSMESIPAHELGSFDLVVCFKGVKSGLENIFAQGEYLSLLDEGSPVVDGPALFNELHLGELQVRIAWGNYINVYELKFREVELSEER